MKARYLFTYVACALHPAHADNSPATDPIITTFDQFIGTEPSASPEPSELDRAVWSFVPDAPRGVLNFRSTDVVKLEKIKALAPGFYAIGEPRGAALALRPGRNGIEARMRVSLASGPKPDELVVSYRASIPHVDPSPLHGADVRPWAIAKVEFSWSLDGNNFTPVKEGDATFMSNDNIVQIAPLMKLDVHGAANEVTLRWRVPQGDASLVIVDDIAVRTRPEQALVIVHVEAANDEKAFIKESLRKALSLRGMTIVTCQEDIDEEVNTAEEMGKLGIHKRDDSPSRIEILQSMTKVGCRAPPGAELWTAWLTVHSDARTGSREVALRMKNLNEVSSQSKIALIAEPKDARWSWSAIIDKVVQRTYGESDRPTVTIPSSARVVATRELPLRPQVTNTMEKPEWKLYRCSNDQACERFYRDTMDFNDCMQKRMAWPGWEASPPPQCFERGYDWEVADVSDDEHVLLFGDSITIEVPGNYVLLATVNDGTDVIKAAERLRVDPLPHEFSFGLGVGLNPVSFTAVLGYGHNLLGLADLIDVRVGPRFVASVHAYKHGDLFIGPALSYAVRFRNLQLSAAFGPGLLVHVNDQSTTLALGIETDFSLSWVPITGLSVGGGLAIFGEYDSQSPQVAPIASGTLSF